MAKLNWKNLTKEERGRYMQLQMSKQSYGRSDYLPDDCHMCGACSQPTMGIGWCRNCYKEYKVLTGKLENNND
jgi:hypothetical protein